MSKGTDNIWRRRCILCMSKGEGITINCVWIAADQLFCANGCATKCVICLEPLADDDALHTCASCTTHLTRPGPAGPALRNVISILSRKAIAGEKVTLQKYISNLEGNRGLASLGQLRIRRITWYGLYCRDPNLCLRIRGAAAQSFAGKKRPSKRLEAAPKSKKTTEFGVVSGHDLRTASASGFPAADLGLVAAASVQLPEEDAHGAELLQATAEDVAEDALADVVLAQADGSGSAASTAHVTRASRGASRLAARLIRGARDRAQVVGRVRGVAAALGRSRPRGWLGEDEASRTPDQIEKKRKRDARRAELRENPDLSKNKQDGNLDVEGRKRWLANRAKRLRRKRKREREREGMGA